MNSILISSRRSTVQGFTLVELLAVITIIAVLAGILTPVIGRMRSTAKTVTCQSNLRQLAVAVQLYANDNKGMVVYDVIGANGAQGTWADGLRSYVTKEPFIIGARPVSVFACPESDLLVSNPTKSDYGKNYYVNPDETSAKTKYRLRDVSPPAKVLMFADATARRLIEGATALVDRHNGKANFICFDNHVESAPASSVVFAGGKLPLCPQQ
jgi:prepilin-type N-terminal cleavage/methylation domain-containing protein/prepilin-type processing-associated H-X9-DG protein